MFGVWVFVVPDRSRGRRWRGLGKTREGVGTGSGSARREKGCRRLALTPTLSHGERGKKRRRRYARRPWVPDRSRGRRKRGGYPIESGKSSRGCAAGGVGVVYVGRIHPRPAPHRAPTSQRPYRWSVEGRAGPSCALPWVPPRIGVRGDDGGLASRLGDARGWLALTPASSAGRAPTLSHEERGKQRRSQIGVGEDEWVGLAALRPCPVGTGCPRYDESEGGPPVGWE